MAVTNNKSTRGNRRNGKSFVSKAVYCLLAAMALQTDAVSAQQINFEAAKGIHDQIDLAVKPFADIIEPYKVISGTFERGIPTLHQDLDCEKHVNDLQCKHEEMRDSPMVGAGHHARENTQTPIIGVLTQPLPSTNITAADRLWNSEFNRIRQQLIDEKSAELGIPSNDDPLERKQYIEASHVKFLESAGARIVPIDFTMDIQQMKPLLEQMNGLYIPGDSHRLVTPHQDYGYTKAVQRILQWSQIHNEDDTLHFPVMGVGYGMLAMVKSQIDDVKEFQPAPQGENLQINLAHEPQHTYLFDEFERESLERILDKIYFYSDLMFGITMEDFVTKERIVSSIFVPVASFHNPSTKNSNEEQLAVIEGVVYPWFGIGYRIDRIQYNLDDQKMHGRLDQSREAIIHAQKIANLFIDEARMSGNEFSFLDDEVTHLDKFRDNESYLVTIPVPPKRFKAAEPEAADKSNDKDDELPEEEQMLTEIYYF